MKWDIRVETNGQQPYSSVDDLTSFEQDMPPYAYCLPRYAYGGMSIPRIQSQTARTAISVRR